ncbi:MAG: hypothetical protein ACRBM6_35710 [Geminicoccales bacterium]
MNSDEKMFRRFTIKRFFLTVSLLAAVLAPAFEATAQQFVLFDETFTYTKEDADTSEPNPSHYYVTGDMLNPERPEDWTAPIDYRNGSVHIRLEVIEKPKGDAPTIWSLCYSPNVGRKNGYGCTSTGLYRTEGVHERDVSMRKFWENDSIVWEKGIKRMSLVIKDDNPKKGHAHQRKDHERYFPTKVRIMMVQVAEGATYDPSLVPGLIKP